MYNVVEWRCRHQIFLSFIFLLEDSEKLLQEMSSKLTSHCLPGLNNELTTSWSHDMHVNCSLTQNHRTRPQWWADRLSWKLSVFRLFVSICLLETESKHHLRYYILDWNFEQTCMLPPNSQVCKAIWSQCSFFFVRVFFYKLNNM